jgi:porin
MTYWKFLQKNRVVCFSVIALSCTSIFSQNSYAQSAQPNANLNLSAQPNTNLNLSAQPNANPDLSAQPNVNLSLRQKIGNVFWDLHDKGIYFTSSYSAQFAANPTGGEKQGSDYSGDLTLGTTFDLQKLVGINGGLIHVLFDDRQGNLLSNQSINTSLSVQNLNGGGGKGQTWQLSILTYEQRLFHNTVDINFGRTDNAFLTSPFYCMFQSHGDCGRPQILAKDTSASVYPEAVWGGRILIKPNNYYVKLGLYQPNPDLNPDSSHGFDWGIKGADGVEVPMEAGYRHTVPGAIAPDQYDVGYIISSAPFNAAFFDSKAPNFDNRGGVYVQAQKMVYQAEPNSGRGIYLFGLGFLGTSGNKQMARYQVSAGAIWQGPLASRPFDYLGFMANDYQYNNEFLESEFKIRQKEGGTEFPDNNQATFELNYSMQATRWLQIMPNFQYIFNPDGLSGVLPFPKANLPNAMVIGLQFSIDLLKLLDAPSYPLGADLDF